MSGGSYDYLSSHVDDLSSRRGMVEEMAQRLEGLPYATAAATATRRVLALLAEAQAAAEQLADVWHDVEWWDSFDYTEAEVRVSVQAYAAQASPDEAPVCGTRRRNSITGRHLKAVAKVYRQTVKAGGAPTRAVATHFEASHSTAARWVSMARTEGLLGPAEVGRSGERKDSQ